MLTYQPVPLNMGQSFIERVTPFQPFRPVDAQAVPINRTEWLAMAGLSLGGLAISGAGAWVGIHTGIKERGLLSFAGWSVGLIMGIGALEFLAGVIVASAGLITMPKGAAAPAPASQAQGEYV